MVRALCALDGHRRCTVTGNGDGSCIPRASQFTVLLIQRVPERRFLRLGQYSGGNQESGQSDLPQGTGG